MGRNGARNLCALDGRSASQRSSIRSAKTDDELTARGYRDTFSSALRLLLDDCQKFRAKNRSSLPFSSEMPLQKGVSGWEGCLESLPYLSLIPPMISHIASPILSKYSYNTKDCQKRANLFPYWGKFAAQLGSKFFLVQLQKTSNDPHSEKQLQILARIVLISSLFGVILGIILANLKIILYLCTLKSTLWKARPYYY